MNQQFAKHKVLRIDWPKKEMLGINEACQRLGLEDDFAELKSAWAGMLALQNAPAPIVGVLGLLNAGKSSLVRGFLSETGASRVLCGMKGVQGTHRFVFWLPQSWRNQKSVWQAFKEELDTVFGGAMEYLADDQENAWKQYNGAEEGKDLFRVPLIAFDPKLDELGFGLLDCPDVESAYPGEKVEGSAEKRKVLVKKAAHLMSVTLVVADRSKVATQTLSNWSDPQKGLAQKQYCILLNYVRPRDGVTELLKDPEVLHLMKAFGVAKIHAAYHGEMNGADEKIPAVARCLDAPEGTPFFFEVAHSEEENEGAVVGEDRLIHRFLSKLQPAEMWARKLETQRGLLASLIDGLETRVASTLDQQAGRIRAKRKALIEFIREMVSKDGKLAFPVHPDVADQLRNAIKKKAPIWAKPTLLAAEGLQQAVKIPAKVLKWRAVRRNVTNVAKGGAEALVKHAKSSGDAIFHKPEDWTSRSMKQKFMPDDVDRSELETAWKMALKHALARKVKLQGKALKLEAFGHELWEGIPIYKRVTLAVSGPFLLLGALAVLITGLVDGGAGVILFTYSLPQFFTALGLGILAPVATGVAGKQLEKDLIEQAGKPFYEELLKAALDVFGLPRRMEGEKADKHHFANTGTFLLELATENDKDPLPPQVPLAGDAIMGGALAEGWHDLRREAVAEGFPEHETDKDKNQ